jgi:small ligand-binding sensory domain FIST
LGARLAAMGVDTASSFLLFYEAVVQVGGSIRLNLATPVLEGMEKVFGELPPINGAGLMSDYAGSSYSQWIGHEVASHQAMILVFSGEVRIDSTVLHGCFPASGYYTITKAEGRTILEVEGKPAMKFFRDIFQDDVSDESLPLFLVLGVNKGGRWDGFSEENYANHLCHALDREHDGIVMIESDMTAGTEFQIMSTSMNLAYIKPRIDALFDSLNGRRPVFALYIDCAGRAAGYAGFDFEDATVIQDMASKRHVPLLGIYSGAEISPVGGRTCILGWTGVFCLFSIPE